VGEAMVIAACHYTTTTLDTAYMHCYHGNQFWAQFAITGFVGYNFGCTTASDTLFDSRGEFSRSSYPMKT